MTETLTATKTLIVGLGSPYGDDQIGWMACERLITEIGHLPAVEFIICDRSGIEWMTKLPPGGQVIFIDAMRSGEKPGTVSKIDIRSERCAECPATLSSHGINIRDAIDLVQSLGDLPEIISVWGVELEQCNYEWGLSESVNTALPTLLENIKSDIH